MIVAAKMLFAAIIVIFLGLVLAAGADAFRHGSAAGVAMCVAWVLFVAMAGCVAAIIRRDLT